MKDCIFCKIVSGDLPGHIVHEDDQTLAFLSIEPIRKGHVLVIPKKHQPEFYKLDSETYMDLMRAVHTVSKKINKILQPKRVGLMVAGWDVPHTHVHVIPMEDEGDITSKILLEQKTLKQTQEELAATAEQLNPQHGTH